MMTIGKKTFTLKKTHSEMRTQRFHKFWLKITAIVVAIAGPIFFLGTMTSTLEPARLTLDLLSWPIDGSITYSSPDTRFLSALTGGFLLGWGVMIWCLSSWVYDKAPEAVRKTVLVGLLCWFFLDSSGSIASGNTSNAIINILVLLTAVGPLWRPAKD
jgi:biotin transporter BioY